jgi:thiamine-monophosphate kinase
MAGLPQAAAWCLGGGEDFELVLALEPPWAEALIAALPGASVVGVLVEGEAGSLGWSDGAPWGPGAGGRGAPTGYSHFG